MLRFMLHRNSLRISVVIRYVKIIFVENFLIEKVDRKKEKWIPF